ncbi:hypothetical protein HaLaN_26590 [Haematococcus lacustris]|uniref:Uncharacterized protein n=1 Tax=Haematococcus lacustris TaxID=44745 RepID=A0A6A0A6L0_HAELA|nr:hypothetical protein HaLaN_26590 [Haematococcus lacustris]
MGEVFNGPTALLDKHERLATHTTASWLPPHALTRNLDCPEVVRGGRLLQSLMNGRSDADPNPSLNSSRPAAEPDGTNGEVWDIVSAGGQHMAAGGHPIPLPRITCHNRCI